MKSPLIAFARLLPSIAGFGALIIAGMVLLGWVFDVELLKRIVPTLVAMNPVTAVCFVSGGASLLWQREGAVENRFLVAARLCALLMLSVGLSKLILLGLHIDLGVDRLLFSTRLEDDITGQPNRMAPNTAMGFLLTGTALFILDLRTRRGYFPAQFVAIGAAMASLLALLGYAYGTRSFYGVGAYIPMALHTALTFLLLVGGILMARPKRGLMAILTGRGNGNMTARRLVPAAIAMPALLGWLCLKGQQSGYYDADFRLSLFVVLTIAAFTALTTLTASLLCRADVRRAEVEAERQRAYDELHRKNAQIEADLDLAREIQQAFLPQQYISFPGKASPAEGALRFHHRYAPTSTLGGDFSDVLLISETQAGAFVCDVMGHGVRSALVTAIVRGQIEEMMPVAHDPGRLLTEVNRSLHTILQRTKTPLFASAVYIVADMEKQELRYASAGHPSPFHASRIVLDDTTCSVQPLYGSDEPGPALGVIPDVQYQTYCRPLNVGDVLILFTDGLVEIESENDEVFEEEQLQRAIAMRLHQPIDQMLDEILAQARHLSPGGQFVDDICLVGIEVMAESQRDT